MIKEGLFAKIITSRGDIDIELEFQKTPGTVGNFIGLCLGKIENSRRFFCLVKNNEKKKNFLL